MEDVLVFAGGIIPDEDIPKLKQWGVVEVFQPGSSLEKIVELLTPQCEAQREELATVRQRKEQLSRDIAEALPIAEHLDRLNEERKAIEVRMLEEAMALVERAWAPSRSALMVSGEGWHPGVIGLIASRLVERYGRPAFAMVALYFLKISTTCLATGPVAAISSQNFNASVSTVASSLS